MKKLLPIAGEHAPPKRTSVVQGRMRFLLIAFLVLVSIPASAQQQPGVVLSFTGRGAARVRGYAVQALRRRLELVRRSDAEDLAEQRGVDLESRDGIRLIASELGVVVVVSGEVEGRGRRTRVTLRVYDARGMEVGTAETNARPGRRGRRAVARELRRLVDSALEAAEARRAEESEREEGDPNWARRSQDEDEEDEETDEDEDEVEDDDGEGVEYPLPLLRLLVGIQARDRVAEVNFIGDAAGGQRGYTASFHPEIGVRLESFPLGGTNSIARGLYFEGEFFYSVALKSVDTTSETTFDTAAWRVLGQVGYLFPIADDFVRFGPMLGFGVDTFTISPGPNGVENTVLRSSQYSLLRAGLSISFRLKDQLARLRFDGAYRHVFGLGDIAVDFGADASASGFDLAFTLDGQYSRFTYGLRLGIVRYALDFSGPAANPAADRAAIVEGSDRSFDLTLQLGIVLE